MSAPFRTALLAVGGVLSGLSIAGVAIGGFVLSSYGSETTSWTEIPAEVTNLVVTAAPGTSVSISDYGQVPDAGVRLNAGGNTLWSEIPAMQLTVSGNTATVTVSAVNPARAVPDFSELQLDPGNRRWESIAVSTSSGAYIALAAADSISVTTNELGYITVVPQLPLPTSITLQGPAAQVLLPDDSGPVSVEMPQGCDLAVPNATDAPTLIRILGGCAAIERTN